VLEHALAYAREGWAVFPVGRDKKPLTPHGFKDATTDEALIHDFWPGEPWYEANIALAIPEGLVVLDFDPRNGAPMPGELGVSTDTRRCATPNGGYHVYYYYDGPELRSRWMSGIDVKQAGKGYVLLPPSVNEAGTRRYEWWRTLTIQKLPPHLAGVLAKPEVPAGFDTSTWMEAETPPTVLFPWENGTAYGLAALKNQLAKMSYAKEGERNNTLTSVGFVLGQLVAGGELREGVLYELLRAAENTGLEKDEIMATLRGCYSRGLQQPRSAPNG